MTKIERQKPQLFEGTTENTGSLEGRSLFEYEQTLGFQKKDLSGKTVLDFGSGPTERLSRELKDNNIDANIISVNPDYKTKRYRDQVTTSPDWQKKSVAAVGQELPFLDNSFDEVLALYSVSSYVDDRFDQVLLEIYRILKPGGTARIAPFMAERLSKNFEKTWKKILPGVNLRIEECDEHWEEGILLRLVFRKPIR